MLSITIDDAHNTIIVGPDARLSKEDVEELSERVEDRRFAPPAPILATGRVAGTLVFGRSTNP